MNYDAVSTLLNSLERELWVITSSHADQRGGLIATFVARASIVPTLPRVLVGLANYHFTRSLIEASGAFAMHAVAEDHLDWVWHFGIPSGRELDKLQGMPARPGTTGSPILADAPVWLDCRVETQMDTGDRTVYLAEVVDAGVEAMGSPMTAARLLELAPADKRQALNAAMARDVELDRELILAWRQRKSIGDERPLHRR